MPESTSAATMHGGGDHHVHAHERQDLSYRWATAADLRQFYGELPGPTLRAVVLLLDDVPAGIIGLARDHDCDKLFSDAKPALTPHMRRFQVLRALRLVMSMVESSARDVYAVRQEGSDILVRLGFEHVEGDIYKWPYSQQHSRT